jgi:hypothetical protein
VDIRPLRPTGPIIAPRGVAIASTPAAAPSRVTSIAPAAPLAPVPTPLHANRPAVSELLLHPVKSFALLVSLLADRRISRARKVAFAVPVALLMLGLVIPQTAVGVLAGLVAPRFGLAFQLPIDAALDWIGVTLLGSTLLRVFPRPIVAQYHARMFHAERAA